MILRKPGKNFFGRTISCANFDPAGGRNLLRGNTGTYESAKAKSEFWLGAREEEEERWGPAAGLSCRWIHRSLTFLRDKVNSGIGLSYRSASPCSLACRYDNPMPESTLSPSQRSMNSATGKTRCRTPAFFFSFPGIQSYEFGYWLRCRLDPSVRRRPSIVWFSTTFNGRHVALKYTFSSCCVENTILRETRKLVKI